MEQIKKVVVVGPGAFGTALTKLAAPNCQLIYQLVFNQEDVQEFEKTHRNKHFPSHKLPQNVYMDCDGEDILGGADVIIWSVPTSACYEVLNKLSSKITTRSIIVVASKGLIGLPLTTTSQIIREMGVQNYVVLSGPNFANQIMRGELSGATIASTDSLSRKIAKRLFTTDRFVVTTSNDVVGVELFGALKNILAIASGALAGMGWGWNSRALLITAGLQEIMAIASTLHANRRTLESLAGIGDVIATCSHRGSRNFQVGYRLAKGEKVHDIIASLAGPAEGINTLKILYEYLRVTPSLPLMPIIENIYYLVSRQALAGEIVKNVVKLFNKK